MPSRAVPEPTLAAVAAAGAEDAGGLDVALLGDFLTVVAAAVTAGEPISARQLRAYQSLGDKAARQGVALRALLDLYLSSAWRLWRHLPPVADAAADPQAVVVAGEVMLHACDDVVASLTEGYQLARRSLVRAQESARREFIEDLLNGSADVVSVLLRADGFGMDLSGPHAVAVIATERAFDDSAPLLGKLERAIQGSKGDAHALIASKEGRLVVVFPAPDPQAINEVTSMLGRTLDANPTGGWQIGLGRPGPGADKVVTSYREARSTLELARTLKLTNPVIDARDLLVYQVLLRDRAALSDLVHSTLAPLVGARGGADPLLATLAAYFNAGGNSASTARDLHLSVRAVTYRLERVRELTGLDPADPQDRFALHVATLGARLLNWP